MDQLILHPTVAALGSYIRDHSWISAAVVAVWTSLFYLRRKSLKLPLPPGPKPRWFIGNLLDIPALYPWKAYNEMRKQYGDVFYLSALGTRILVVNSLDATNELLGVRAPNSSDRPYTPVTELIHMDWVFSIQNYGSRWRERRRLFHRALNYTQLDRYHPVIEQELKAFLPRLLANPKDHRDLLRYALAGIIMRVAYGSEDYEYNKRLAHSAEAITQGFMKYSDPALLLVNTIHSLRFVPSWMPGARWKRELAELADHSDAVVNDPWNATKERLKSGTQSDYSALAVQFMEQLPKEADPEFRERQEAARDTAAIAYSGGADTSISLALAIVLALTKDPQIQRRAQEELDTIFGVARLPTAGDMPNLPYIQAIVKEGGRWHTVLPLAVPHLTTTEDIYNGYRIPAGTIILPNSWAIMHDPENFEDPFSFKPERYIKNGKIDGSVLDGEAAAFGYGRRICPGRHFSSENLQLLVATLLACFNIEPCVDEDGNQIPLNLEVPNIPIATPLPYECNFVPRSQRHIDLIQSFST